MDIISFFEGLSGFEKILYWIAIPSSIIFLLQTIMTFVGMGADEIDLDYESDSELEGEEGGNFQIFTFRNFVAFFATFGWTGITCIDNGLSNPLSIFISALTGLSVMFMIAGIFYAFNKMAENRAIRLEDSIGRQATVDVRIPSKGKGSGKINITVGGALRNMDASSNGPEIPRGSKVKVTGVDNNELIVDSI